MGKRKLTQKILSELKKLAGEGSSEYCEKLLKKEQKFGNSGILKYKPDAGITLQNTRKCLETCLEDFKIEFNNEIRNYVVSHNNTPRTNEYLVKRFKNNQSVAKNRLKDDILSHMKIIIRKEDWSEKLKVILASFNPHIELRYVFLCLEEIINKIDQSESLLLDIEIEQKSKKEIETLFLNAEQQNELLLSLKKKLSNTFLDETRGNSSCQVQISTGYQSDDYFSNETIQTIPISIPAIPLLSIYTLKDNLTVDQFSNPSENQTITEDIDIGDSSDWSLHSDDLESIKSPESWGSWGIIPDNDDEKPDETDNLQFTNIVSYELLTPNVESNSNDIMEVLSQHDSSIYINHELLLFNSLLNLPVETMIQLINSNLWILNDIIVKCRSTKTLPLYSDQQTDLFCKNISMKFISSSNESFEAIKIDEDGNCLYKTVSMYLFGNQDYHIQLRLASIYVILYNSKYFRQLLVHTKGESNSHIEQIVNEIARPNSWGDNIIMIALSIVVNRPLCYIQASDEKALDENYFRISYAFQFQLNIEPIKLLSYNKHFVPLVATNLKETIFDFSSITFDNEFSQFIIPNEFFN